MYTFAEAVRLPDAEAGEESQRLGRFPERLAPGFVVGASFEEGFYRSNNLPEQLRRLFRGVNPRRLDEDQLEALCSQASALLRGSSLLDDQVQLFLRALMNAGLSDTALHLRRPGEGGSETARTRPPGAEALHALKRLWARDWSFAAVLGRLDTVGSVALEARPVLIFAGEPGQPDAELAAELGLERAWTNALGLVGAE